MLNDLRQFFSNLKHKFSDSWLNKPIVSPFDFKTNREIKVIVPLGEITQKGKILSQEDHPLRIQKNGDYESLYALCPSGHINDIHKNKRVSISVIGLETGKKIVQVAEPLEPYVIRKPQTEASK